MILTAEKICLLLLIGLSLPCNSRKTPVDRQKQLINIIPKEIPPDCCQDQNLNSCKVVDVQTEILRENHNDIVVLGKTLHFEHTIPPNGVVYSDQKGNQAIIRYIQIITNFLYLLSLFLKKSIMFWFVDNLLK